MANNNKIESRAITALRSIIDAHPTMEHHFYEGDKEMSWDGTIRIYLSNTDASSKKNFDDDVPVQIKGHINPNNIGQERAKQSVDLDDLGVYFRHRGCLYFQIYMTEDGKKNEIFYCSLFPNKIRYYLEQGKDQKTITIPFVRLSKDYNYLYDIVKQFSIESKKQGFGDGPIMSKRLTAKDVENIRRMTVTTTGATSPYEMLKKISTGDASLYAELAGGFPVPLPWSDQLSATISQTIEDTVGVKDRIYFNQFQMETTADGPGTEAFSLEEQTVLKLSPNVALTFNKGVMNFKIELWSDLSQIGHDARFLLDVVENQSLTLGEKETNAFNPTISDLFKNQLEGMALVADVLDESKIKINVPFKELTEEDKSQIDLLVAVKEGKVKFNTNKENFAYHWKFRGKKIPLLISRSDDRIKLTNIAFDNTLIFTIDSETSEKLPDDALIIPNIAMLDLDVLSNLYYYDYEALYEQVDRSVVNIETEDTLNNLALRLISVYDKNGKEELLDIASAILERLLDEVHDAPHLRINLLQIEKRKRNELSEESKALLSSLPDMIEKKPDGAGTDMNLVLDYCISVLLDDFCEADRLYSKFSEKEKTAIDGYPIQALKNKAGE